MEQTLTNPFLFCFFSYRGGVDTEGHPVMVVVGAHFLLRCLDLERFVLYVIKVSTQSHTSMVLQLAATVSKTILYCFFFLLYMVSGDTAIGTNLQEFEPVIQKPYSIVYFHSAASLQV